jgi:transposase
MKAAEQREPYESRGSRTVLGEPGGESPPGHSTNPETETALRWKIPTARSERIQKVLQRESGMTEPAIAEAMAVSLSTVKRALAYDGLGIKALKRMPIGGRQRENMTLTEEKALLACFAKAPGQAKVLNIHDLKAAYEQTIGHPTSNCTIYDLLARHGWRKLMPRPFHPERIALTMQALSG